MIKFIFLLLIFILPNCSLDDKTGIWNDNSNLITEKKVDIFKDFETLYTEQKSFDEVIPPPLNLQIFLDPKKNNTKWLDEFYSENNRLKHFSYQNENKLIFKSKKLTKYLSNDNIFYDGFNIIIADKKGNIIVYSAELKKIIYEFNFYKKKFKKIKKNLNIIINKNIIYVSDNLGYLYALDYNKQKILWAKNYSIPFRSNLKIKKNILFLADQNNILHLINSVDGERFKLIPTEDTTLKNSFKNSLVLDESHLFYLNTYGSLYSININRKKISWFINLNRSIDINSSNLFYSSPISIVDDRIIVPSDPYLYLLNKINGSIISKTPIHSSFKPIISGDQLFLITKKNLLVCLDLKSGEIIYSLDIELEIAQLLDSKKKPINIKNFYLSNKNILIFLNNSYIVSFTTLGKIKEIKKLPAKIGSLPIFINNSIMYLSKKNKLIIAN